MGVIMSTTMHERDVEMMQKALVYAKRAGKAGEIPIGAVVVDAKGQILGAGANRVEATHCQSEHAEVRAINKACRRQGDWRLDGCTLYVTLEPCMMCISLTALSRIERVVFGAPSPVFGYRLDKEGALTLYTKRIKNITEGVLAEPASQLLKDFFRQKDDRK